MFIKSLGISKGKINCISNNEEKYISFSQEYAVYNYTTKNGKDMKHEVRFIDSFKFMASSFDRLIANLQKDRFRNLAIFYQGKQLDLLKRKGVYPYDYRDSLGRLAKKQLPPKEALYFKLNNILG